MSGREEASGSWMKAYSLLKIADAIEEASTCRTQDENNKSSKSNGLSDISKYMQILEEEQKSILGLVRSSLSDIATVASRESIPFDERSQSLASLTSSQGKCSPVPETDTRDDEQMERITRQLVESEERVKPTIPFEKRAELSRSLGPYLYSKIHSSQDRPHNEAYSISHSSSFLEPPSNESDNQEPDKSSQIRPSPHFATINNNSRSEDSDDTIGKLRDDAESTIDAAEYVFDQSSIDSLSGPLHAPSKNLSLRYTFDPLDQPRRVGSSRIKEGTTTNRAFEKGRAFSDDLWSSSSSCSSSSIDGCQPHKNSRSKSVPKQRTLCRPPKASREHLQKQGSSKKWGKGLDLRLRAGKASQDLGGCRTPRSPESSNSFSDRERSRSAEPADQRRGQRGLQEPHAVDIYPTPQASSPRRALNIYESQKRAPARERPRALKVPIQSKTCRQDETMDARPVLLVSIPDQMEVQEHRSGQAPDSLSTPVFSHRQNSRQELIPKESKAADSLSVPLDSTSRQRRAQDPQRNTIEVSASIPEPRRAQKPPNDSDGDKYQAAITGTRSQSGDQQPQINSQADIHHALMARTPKIGNTLRSAPEENHTDQESPGNNHADIHHVPLTSSPLRSAPAENQTRSLLDHQTRIPTMGGEACTEEYSSQRSSLPATHVKTTPSSMQGLETRQQGRHMLSRTKPQTKVNPSKDLKLDMQASSSVFAPAPSPVDDVDGTGSKEPEQGEQKHSATSSPQMVQTEDQLSKNAKVKETQSERPSHIIKGELIQKHDSMTKGSIALMGQQTPTTRSKRANEEEKIKTEASESEMMLEKCYSAIFSLKETSESKYQALESKYLELKGSFSYLETHNKHNKHIEEENSNKEHFGLRNEVLEYRHREMQSKIAKLESQNHQLLEETKTSKSQHEALKESSSQLETQNRRLRESAVQQDDEHAKLKKSTAKLLELNTQLEGESKLSRQLEAQCEGIEGRCVELQKDFFNLEAQNSKLKEENIYLLVKYEKAEAERKKLEELTRQAESRTPRDVALEAECQQLEQSNNHLISDNDLLQKEKQQLQDRCQQLKESKKELVSDNNLLEKQFQPRCQHLEELNSRLESENRLFQKEKIQFQARCQQLEDSNSQLQSDNNLLGKEKTQFHARCQQLEESSSKLLSDNCLLETEKQQFQARCQQLEEANSKLESDGNLLQPRLLAMEARCLVLEDLNGKLKSHIDVLTDEKDELHSKFKLTESNCNEVHKLTCQEKSQQSLLQDDKQKLQSRWQEMEPQYYELDESNATLKSQTSVFEDENEKLQSRLQEMKARYQEMEDANSALKSQACDLQNEKLDFQSRLEAIDIKVQELIETSSQLRDQNQQLEDMNDHLRSNLQSIDATSSELERSNEQLATQKLAMEEQKEDFVTKLQAMETKCLDLEQANCHLKSHNMKLEDINESFKAMQTSLEGNLQEARRHIKDLTALNHVKNRKPFSRQISEVEYEPISCISSESAQSADNEQSRCPAGYEVVSSQDLKSYSLSAENRQNQSWNGTGIVELTTDIDFEEQLRERLALLADATRSSEEEQQLVNEELDQLSAEQEETQKRDTVASANGEGTTERQSGGKRSAGGTLPPLSPRTSPSTRPPLPPPMPSTPRQSNTKKSDQSQRAKSHQPSTDELQTSSTDSYSSAETDNDEPVPSRKAKREQTPSSILQEIMHEPDDSGAGQYKYKGHQGEVLNERNPAPFPPPDQRSRRSRKEKRYEESNAPLSPDQQSNGQTRQGGWRHHDPKLTKSTSSSQVMATLFGSGKEPKVIPEYFTAQGDHMKNGVVVLRNNEGVPLMSAYPESKKVIRSPVKEADSSSCEEESNSIVTQTSTHTRDLLNSPPRRTKKMMSKHVDQPIVKAAARLNQQPKSPCDWFMPLEFDPPQSPPEELSVAAPRANIGIRCDSSGCGVDILPSSCSSILARRTWNYGKKQSRVIGNSEHSSIVTVTSNPTGTTTTILAGGGTTITTAGQGHVSSFDQSNTSDSGSAANSTSKFHVSPILAKRDKLRRKQGHNVAQSSANSSGSSSQSEKHGLKVDKKVPLRPLSSGGTFPFL